MNNFLIIFFALFVGYVIIVAWISTKIGSTAEQDKNLVSTQARNTLSSEQYTEPDFNLEVGIENNRGTAEIVSDGVAPRTFTYAFYLVVDGVRVDVRWYEPSAVFQFDLPEKGEEIEILAFVKHQDGATNTLRATIP